MSIASLLSSIAGYVSSLDTCRTNIRSALVNQGVSASDHDFSDFAADIASISGGGVTTTALSVTANGTYTAPTGTAYTPVTVNVSGGSVIPSDLPSGKALIVGYSIPAGVPEDCKTITLRIVHDSADTVSVVDWGDNTATTTSTGSGAKSLSHTYTDTGDHIASVSVSGGTISVGGTTLGHNIGGTVSYVQSFIKWAVINAGVSMLEDYAFSYCMNMEEIRLSGSSITKIDSYAFQYCAKLKTFDIPNTVTAIGSYAFYYCTGLLTVSLPDNASFTAISNDTFSNCFSVSEMSLPSRISSFGNNSFNNCYNWKNVVIPSNVTDLPSSVFSQCRSFTSLTIPSSITSIGSSAFNYLVGLQKLRFNGTTPPAVANSNAFSSLRRACIISVPTGYLSAYTSAQNYPSSSSYTYIEE